MKTSIAKVIIPLLFSAIPAVAAEEASESCDQKYETVSAAWSDARAELTQEDEVVVSTDEGEVDVTAKDAGPTENWFGKPPNVKTIDAYLKKAERAMQDGDTEACLAELQNVEDAMGS